MKLRNTTDYDSAELRSLIRSVVREVEATLRKSHPNRDLYRWSPEDVKRRAAHILQKTEIWVRQRRGGATHHTGRASYSAQKMVLTIGDDSVVGFLWLARHEVWHLFGVRHEDFPEAVMHNRGGSYAALREVYADVIARWGVSLVKAPVREKVKPTSEERAIEKLSAILDREKRWTTKLKRAQTALKKLKKSRTYYEKQIALAAGKGSS